MLSQDPFYPHKMPQPNREDARELLTRLYRDIGISAVAAALHVTNEADRRSQPVRKLEDLPAILRGDDLAA